MITQYSYSPEFKDDFHRLTHLKHATELRELDGIGTQLDVNKFSREFFSKTNTTTADVSVDSNSNVDVVSVMQYNNELAKPLHRLNAYYLLWKYGRRLMSEDIAYKMIEAQFKKDIYINDFHTFSGNSYCFNFSCMDVLYQGLPFVNKIKSGPPKHLTSFMGQMIQFITYTCNSIAGAVGLADLLICASYFVDKLRKEHKNIDKKFLDKIIKQELQSFIYSVNQPFRSSIQSPFTNISIFDEGFLDKMCNEYLFPDRSKPNKETIKELQVLFVNLMNETLRVTPCTFPITTACFSIDDNKEVQDKEFLDFISKENLEFGFMNLYAGKTSTLSSCCRLRSDTTNEYFNTFGSGGTKIGSASVVTLNIPRLAYIHKTNKEKFFEALEEKVELISQINHVKRYIINKRIEGGQSPLYSLGFMNLQKQYSTVGLVGVNEAIEIFGLSVLEKEGQDLVLEILNRANKVNERQQKKYKTPHNVEQVPAENSAIKLAKSDQIMEYNNDYDIYSNQFIPLTTKADIVDRLELQGLFDSKMTGGAICHLNIEDKITSKSFMKNLIEEAIKLGVIYFAVNYNLQECKVGHMSVGKNKKCPICGEKISYNYSRVVGFLTRVDNWHYVRRTEDYPNRVWYKAENEKK